MKLLVFESHPVQYYAPIYRELDRICRSGGPHCIKVFYATDASVKGHFDSGFRTRVAWDEDLLEGYSSSVLHNEVGEPLKGFRSLCGKGVWSLLRSERPDAVMVTGFFYEFDWAVISSAILLRIPIWFRADTNDQAFERSFLKKTLRSWVYRVAYLILDRAVVRGMLNSEHFERHGLGKDRQIYSPHCVPDRFEKLTESQKVSLRNEVRNRLGIAENATLLLFCGKLQPKKNPGLLLEALASMTETKRARFAVLYVGAGELECPLRTRVREIAHANVVFAGFKNQTDLAPYYLASDVLVLPSRQMGETWGLVANEALLAERRLILSRHVGCHADFQQLPSVRVFDGSLSDFMSVLLRELPAAETTQGQREFMRRYSIEAAAQGIARAMGSHPSSPPVEPLNRNGSTDRLTERCFRAS